MALDAGALADAFGEPLLVLRTDGTVLLGNRAARALLGDLAGANLATFTSGGADRLRGYLKRCSGSRSATIGKMVLRGADGCEHAFRCHGSLLNPRTDSEPASILVRLAGPPEERFSALTRQVRDLNAEVRRRRRVQMTLEETLHERELLLRELNHRVKNNLQMLLSMLSGARAGAQNAESRLILDRACSRVAAIGAAQNVFYRAGVGSISTADFLDQVCRAVMNALGNEHELALQVTPAQLPSDLAAPLALMLNELITNAVKHGLASSRRGRIDVALAINDSTYELTVADNGIGFDASEIRAGASGLGLVRGLAGQLGGSVEVGAERGTRCTVRFRDSTYAEGATNAPSHQRLHHAG